MRLCELHCYFSAWGGPSECSFFLTFRLIKKALVNVWTAQEVWSSFHLHKLPVPSFLGLKELTLWRFSSSFQLLLLQQCNLTDFLPFNRRYRPLHVQSMAFPALFYSGRYSPFEPPPPPQFDKQPEHENSKTRCVQEWCIRLFCFFMALDS